MSPWPSLATVAALLVYYVLCINVSRARAKYDVPAPKMSGLYMDYREPTNKVSNRLPSKAFPLFLTL